MIYLSIILRKGASGEKVSSMLKERLKKELESLGAICPDIQLQFVDVIERDSQKMGKLKIINSNIKRPNILRQKIRKQPFGFFRKC